MVSLANYLRGRAIRFRALASRANNVEDARYLVERAADDDLQADALKDEPTEQTDDTAGTAPLGKRRRLLMLTWRLRWKRR